MSSATPFKGRESRYRIYILSVEDIDTMETEHILCVRSCGRGGGRGGGGSGGRRGRGLGSGHGKVSYSVQKRFFKKKDGTNAIAVPRACEWAVDTSGYEMELV
jgi:hypothetical protein